MKGDEIEKLLGGYATGTLTPEERAALFAAALEDQQVFEALLEEEPLRETLEDPAARARLLAALEDASEKPAAAQPWYYRDVHPGIIAGAAAAVILITLAVTYRPVRTAPPVTVVAQTDLPQPSKSVLPAELPPQFRFGGAPVAVPKLPAAPRLPMPGSAETPQEVRDAIDKLLIGQNSTDVAGPVIAGPAGTVEIAREAVRPGAMLFAPRAPARGPSVPPALRYTILRKLPDGEMAPVDSRQPLGPGDETLIRFEAAEAGYLYVLERSTDGLRRIATEQVAPSVAYTVPREGTFHNEGNGPREFQAVFSREPQNVPDRVLGVVAIAGQPAAARPVSGSEPAPPTLLFITLRYPSQ
jgi:hypothetical protein